MELLELPSITLRFELTSRTLGAAQWWRLRTAFDIMSQTAKWTEPVRGPQAKREYDKALRSCHGLDAGLEPLSCTNSFSKGAGLGISIITFLTKPNNVINGGNAFSSLTFAEYTHVHKYRSAMCWCYRKFNVWTLFWVGNQNSFYKYVNNWTFKPSAECGL